MYTLEHLGLINLWKNDSDGGIQFSSRLSIVEMVSKYRNLIVAPIVDALGDRPYDSSLFPDRRMTYRRDILGDNGPEAFINCFTAFEAYALLVGSEHPARFVPGRDEICGVTAFGFHCIYADEVDTYPDRLAPDESDLEVITNLLRMREFVKQGYIPLEHLPFFRTSLRYDEKWLSRISIEIDGKVVDPLDDQLRYIDVNRITLLTNLGVMLDHMLYIAGIQYDRPEIEMMEYGANGSDDLEKMYGQGFSLAQFFTTRKN